MGDDFGKALVVYGIVTAVAGWVVIEGAIWIFSHIKLGWS